MFIGGLVSAMIISLLIGLFLGNLRLGLRSLIPNLFPAGIVYGIWGLTVGVIDIAAAVRSVSAWALWWMIPFIS
ncbi:MAG: hypothetical protein CML06_03105 [Pseudomonadales bacterium]|nr:hypothetical protein [Pseudomonadales bacterium]